MIGWENDRGGFYINKLQEQIDAVKDDASDIAENIGDLTELETTSKTNVVSAINEALGDIGDVAENIGDLTDLNTQSKTNVVSAINETFGIIKKAAEVVPNSSESITVSSSSSLLVISAGTSSSRTGMWVVKSSSTGALTIVNVMTPGANVSITATDSSLNLNNLLPSGTGSCHFFIITLEGMWTKGA